jgi:hypothetical protein
MPLIAPSGGEWSCTQLVSETQSLERGAYDRTVCAAVVETTQAPPATVFLHALQLLQHPHQGGRRAGMRCAPDADSLPLDRVLAAERACVARVLGDFHLFHLLPQRGTCVQSFSRRQSLAWGPVAP